jgi:asparagine synthase (glutamine-hydrolysing)
MNTIAGRDPGALRLITHEAQEAYEHEIERYVHPWFREAPTPPPSSVLLLYGLLTTTSTDYHVPFTEFKTLNHVHPLVSQPLLEIALRVPGAFSVKSGWNRAAARAAFCCELSKDVSQRTCKTSTTPWVTETIRQHAGWLREFLLDGALACNGILDRQRVEAVLANQLSAAAIIPAELFYHIYIEGWLRQWLA